MYRKEDVLRKLNSDNYYIDVRALETFIAEWQIDPIYEAKDGTEFFDDIAIYKLKKGISLKSQGYHPQDIQPDRPPEDPGHWLHESTDPPIGQGTFHFPIWSLY